MTDRLREAEDAVDGLRLELAEMQQRAEKAEVERDRKWRYYEQLYGPRITQLETENARLRAVAEYAAKIPDLEVEAAPEWLAELRHHARRALEERS